MKQLRECFCQLCRQTYNDGDKGRPRSVALQLSMNRFQATCELPSSYKNHTLFLSPLFGLLQCCALLVHQLPRRRPFILQISFLILRWGNGNIVHRSSQCRQIQTGTITIGFFCSDLLWTRMIWVSTDCSKNYRWQLRQPCIKPLVPERKKTQHHDEGAKKNSLKWSFRNHAQSLFLEI